MKFDFLGEYLVPVGENRLFGGNSGPIGENDFLDGKSDQIKSIEIGENQKRDYLR